MKLRGHAFGIEINIHVQDETRWYIYEYYYKCP